MKQLRRRRHLRPRPTRSMINQQVQHVRTTLQAFQLEWILEARRSECSGPPPFSARCDRADAR